MLGWDTWGKKRLQACACVFVLSLLPFLPSSRFQLVGWDDTVYIRDNVRLREGLTANTTAWAFTSCGYADNWHPLAWTSLAADVSLARALDGECAWDDLLKASSMLSTVMHVHNMLLHAANAALLFLFLCAFLDELKGDAGRSAEGRQKVVLCAFLALLWSLHPLRTEVVCWATERKEVLSVFFMLLTLLAYRCSHASGRALALTAFALALLAKPVAVTLPAVLFAWDYALKGESLSRTASRVLPFGALSAIAAAFTMTAQQEAMPRAIITLLERIVTALKAPFVYLAQTVCPINLSINYASGLGRWDLPWIVPGVLLPVFLAWVVLKWIRTRKESFSVGVFGIAWCYVGLLPMLGIVKVGSQPHSDRYTYWVGCGLVVLLAYWLLRGWETWGRRLEPAVGKSLIKAGVALLAVMAVATGVQAEVWRNSEALFRNAWEKSREPVMAELLARVMWENGKKSESENLMRGCASDQPGPIAYAYLGLYLVSRDTYTQGNIEEALHFAHRAEEVYPKCAEVQQVYGDVERLRGNLKNALEYYMKAKEYGLISLGLQQRIDWTCQQLEKNESLTDGK